MDTDWKSLQSDIAEIMESCGDDKSWQAIVNRLSPLQSKIADVQTAAEQKAAAHKMWLEHLEACDAAHEKIAQLEEKLANADLTPDQMSQLRTDLESAREQLRDLEEHEAEMKAALQEADVVFKDRSTEEAVDTRLAVDMLLTKVAGTGMQLGEKSERLAQITDARQRFDETKETLGEDLEKLRENVASAEVVDFSLQGVKDMIENLRAAQMQQMNSEALHEQLQTISRQLAAVDPLSVNQARAEVGQIEADWHNVAALTSQKLDDAVAVAECWEAFDDTKKAVSDALKKAESVLESTGTPCSSLEQMKKAVELLKVCTHFMEFVVFFFVVFFDKLIAFC
jgi:chromosome segregation ATPase